MAVTIRRPRVEALFDQFVNSVKSPIGCRQRTNTSKTVELQATVLGVVPKSEFIDREKSLKSI